MLLVMSDMNRYDTARNHFMGSFPALLSIEHAYTHIGMYLGWMIELGLYSDYFKEEAASHIFRFKRREISCIVLSELWEGYLGAEQFSAIGNMFTYYYYSSGLYQNDYNEVLVKRLPSRYHVSDNWDNYDQIKKRIDKRFQDWKRIMNS